MHDRLISFYSQFKDLIAALQSAECISTLDSATAEEQIKANFDWLDTHQALIDIWLSDGANDASTSTAMPPTRVLGICLALAMPLIVKFSIA